MTPPHYNQLATQLAEADQVIDDLAHALAQFIEAPWSGETNVGMDSYLRYKQHYPKGGQSRATSTNGKGASTP